MKNLGFRFLLIATVVVLATWSWMAQEIRMGLDLAGGASLTFEVTTQDGNPPDAEKMKRVIEVLEARLNASGLAEISIMATQANEILVELPGLGKEQLESIEALIKRNGELEFRILAPPSVQTSEAKKKKDAAGTDYYDEPVDATWFPRTEGGETLVKIPEKPQQKELAQLEAQKEAGKPVDEDRIKALRQEILVIQDKEMFTGNQLSKTKPVQQNLEWVVSFEFITDRRTAFTEFTERNLKQPMAIILDGKVSSAPVIQSRLSGGGIIEGGGSRGFTFQECNDLAIVLESGSAGVKMVKQRDEVLGPSLGQDAIQRGMMSIAAGFIAVLIAMVWLYRLPGMVANVALLLNVLILMGVMAFFRAALSLPGIAGIVLTLGMAVDANILVFERLKEERKRGKSLAESLSSGYDRALVAILDANATTVLTALVLIFIGTGSVKGFGVTLTVGILASLFTAIYVTRTIFEYAIQAGWMTDLKMGRERNVPTFDFMKVRRFFTGPSLVLMVLGFGLFLARPEAESKDLEFIGGQQVTLQGKTAQTIQWVREQANTGAFDSVAVVTLAPKGLDSVEAGQTNRFRLRVKATDDKEGEKFVQHVRATFAKWLLPAALENLKLEPGKTADDPVTVTTTLNTLDTLEGDRLAAFKRRLEADGQFSQVTLTPVGDTGRAFEVSLVSEQQAEAGIREKFRLAAKFDGTTEGSGEFDELNLSDPLPALSFLNASRAEQLWRGAMQAVLLALVFQILYIRLRFADFKHGFAAVCALLHDTVIALGFVAVFDATGLVHAKINLVLVAAFLTLIGYSMNDTIVVFDRIRENLGKGRVVLGGIVNDSLNQTLARSIRTSITTLMVVLIQFVVNRGTGSVLEGFAFVMVVGVISGTYSSIFIAAPLLLFLPLFWKSFSAHPRLAAAQVVATLVGSMMAVTATGHSTQMYVGLVLASNIVVHFLYYFVPWLRHRDPDELLSDEIAAEEDVRPLVKPGI